MHSHRPTRKPPRVQEKPNGRTATDTQCFLRSPHLCLSLCPLFYHASAACPCPNLKLNTRSFREVELGPQKFYINETTNNRFFAINGFRCVERMLRSSSHTPQTALAPQAYFPVCTRSGSVARLRDCLSSSTSAGSSSSDPEMAVGL